MIRRFRPTRLDLYLARAAMLATLGAADDDVNNAIG